MCGIVAYLGSSQAWPILVQGLAILQNRGYDSAGVASYCGAESKIKVFKQASTSSQRAIEALEDHNPDMVAGEPSTGIGHTRWATHGPRTSENAHPHLDETQSFAIVHNGIIENYLEWKGFLETKGYSFSSQTDSEVIVVLWSYYYTVIGDVTDAFRKTIASLEGTWGIVGMSLHTPLSLYCARHGSPLLLAVSDGQAFVASQAEGFGRYAKSYICLKSHDIATLTLTKNGQVALGMIDPSLYPTRPATHTFDLTPAPYRFWTEKEIASQGKVVGLALKNGGRVESTSRVCLGGIADHTTHLLSHNHLVFLGCGTSLHAALAMKPLYQSISGFQTVQAVDGAAFTLGDVPDLHSTLLIFISQSGETKDLARCVDMAKENDLFMVGIVNAVDSLIAREVNCGVYLNAGREVGVASTKAFTGQITVLSLIAVWFSQERGLKPLQRKRVIRDLQALPFDVEEALKADETPLVHALQDKTSAFVLGKGPCHATALEASLKLKEIAYIHVEGFEGSSLKHGPFALLTKHTPVVLLMPASASGFGYEKMINGLEEIQARNAPLVVVTDTTLAYKVPVVKVPANETFGFLLCLIPLQKAAFNLAISQGINPDYPRNLAKVVTVE